MAAGAVVAHTLGYRIATPHPEHREELLAETGHGWFDASLLLALALTLVVIGLGARLLATGRAPARRAAPARLFAVLPPAAFALQEHLERLLHEGAPAPAFLEPAFALGLLLQFPFALAAFVAARALLAGADALVRRLQSEPHRHLRPAEPGSFPPARTAVARVSALALGHGQRAPPAWPEMSTGRGYAA
jgi:hypothetical protein